MQASHLQVKSLDALSKLREARLALMNDKIMEQKFIETGIDRQRSQRRKPFTIRIERSSSAGVDAGERCLHHILAARLAR